MVEPFKIHITESEITDLKDSISKIRWSDEIQDSNWKLGTSLSFMRELADHWLKEFDWRKVENEINAYPNFIADIDGNRIHFMHIKEKGKKSIPLMITHGWPGSFLEMMKLIPLLTQNEDLGFDLVIPSVIGFGFSSKVTHKGCNSAFIADLWHRLMLKLGYERSGVQGGGIGAGISTWLS